MAVELKFELAIVGRPETRNADLMIWDFVPGSVAPPGWEAAAHRRLILVCPADAPALATEGCAQGALALLHPVRDEDLAGVLHDQGLRLRAETAAAEVEGLRAERDALLQRLLRAESRLALKDDDRRGPGTETLTDACARAI